MPKIHQDVGQLYWYTNLHSSSFVILPYGYSHLHNSRFSFSYLQESRLTQHEHILTEVQTKFVSMLEKIKQNSLSKSSRFQNSTRGKSVLLVHYLKLYLAKEPNCIDIWVANIEKTAESYFISSFSNESQIKYWCLWIW